MLTLKTGFTQSSGNIEPASLTRPGNVLKESDEIFVESMFMIKVLIEVKGGVIPLAHRVHSALPISSL